MPSLGGLCRLRNRLTVIVRVLILFYWPRVCLRKRVKQYLNLDVAAALHRCVWGGGLRACL